MQNRLKVEFRQKQLYKEQDPAQPIIVQCNNGVAEYIPGTVPKPNWEDMTQHTEGLDKFKLSWDAVSSDFTQGDDTGEANSFGSNYGKGLSVELRFFSSAFQYIFDWLMTDECQILNAVEVRITDMDCGKAYRIFELKVDNTEYAPYDEPCILFMPLRELDSVWHSFQKTIIEDNWQGWFNKDGTSTKDHPTFLMIVEKKPKFFLAVFVVLIYVVGMLSGGALLLFNEGRQWVRKTLGFSYFCPSPLIRTYIENICQKYGYTFNTLFDDDPANPYRDVCLFWPASKTYKNFLGFTSPSTKFLWDNRTVLSFSKFLNQLKKLFNAEWYVTPNKELVFQHRSYFDNQPPIYDFTNPAATLGLYNLRYTFNGDKKAAYGNYQYAIDPQDTCTNEVKWRYNAIVDYDGPNENPMLEGNVSKTFDFAGTAFHKDGSTEDFIEESVKVARVVAVVGLLIGLGEIFLAANPITVGITVGILTLGYTTVNGYINDFFNSESLTGCVRTAASEVNMPRLLMWDRNTPLNESKVVYVEDPAPNLYYNEVPVDYYEEHPAYEAPAGYFGNDITRIYNYPMYIEEMFVDNLYDRFHEYDNPMKNPALNQDWEGEVDLCCESLDLLGVWEGDYAKIGAVLILEKRGTRLIKGRIEHFEPNYDTGRISLKGKVLK